MLLKSVTFCFLVLACAIFAPAASTSNYHHYCPQCEEEVWEEVPCEEVATTSRPSTTTTARPQPSTTRRPHTTAHPPVKKTTTTKPRVAQYITPTPPVTTTAATTYNNCYCECKGGCKEFCRKVTVNGAAQATQKQITQVTKTTQRVPNGQLNSEHVHQLKFVPDSQTTYTPVQPSTQSSLPPAIYPIHRNKELINPYLNTNLAYKVQPAMLPQSGPPIQSQPVAIAYPQPAQNLYEDPQVTNIYPDALLESSYSVDELTRLLQMEHLNNAATNSYTQSINGPSYAIHGSFPQTPPSTAPIYQPHSLSYGIPTSAAESNYESNSSESQYKEDRLDIRSQSYASPLLPASEPQYANYVHKMDLSESQFYTVASPSLPSQQAGYDQLSSSTVGCHNTYDDHSTKFLNSISYGTEYAPPPLDYIPQSELYLPSY
ncbi:PREDICTED: mucin-5AC [Bactrocera latifrons]|uniref:mucin-5AC n=1 Tax=Bactrocera latifrons TaxID=174628 RepID=UPI0008DE206A|nr:PREDICTED: mucin-5AC [Bactrocera latifrons]